MDSGEIMPDDGNELELGLGGSIRLAVKVDGGGGDCALVALPVAPKNPNVSDREEAILEVSSYLLL
jgi:hypothetical protein